MVLHAGGMRSAPSASADAVCSAGKAAKRRLRVVFLVSSADHEQEARQRGLSSHCIFTMDDNKLEEKQEEQKPTRRHSREISEVIADSIRELPSWLFSHVHIVAIAALILACIIIVVVFSRMNGEKKAEEEKQSIGEAFTPGDVVPEVPMEQNAYPAVDALVRSYFEAISRGDAETVKTLARDLDETEALNIEVRGEYIESVPKLEVYTKKGLLPDTYVAYVLNYMQFKGYEDALVPGMKTFYICKDADGSYYIQMGIVSDEEEAYITGVTLQQDVKDLNNRVAVEYNELIAGNSELNDFLVDVKVMTKERVGEMMIARGEEEEAHQTEESAGEGESSASEAGTSAQAQPEFPRKAKVTTKINVRSSDSIEADKKGQIAGGTEVEVLENRANGWSRISFEGSDAYVKTEFLSFPDTETVSADAVTGSVTAKENVNIRAKADQDSEKLGVAQGGEKLELIEKMSNGWCKIRYNGAAAYVKTEFVE